MQHTADLALVLPTGHVHMPSRPALLLQVASSDKLLAAMALLKLGLVRRKVLLFVNSVDAGYRLKLFLEAFGVRAALLNAELPLNSRSHILETFNKGLFDYLIATGGWRWLLVGVGVEVGSVQLLQPSDWLPAVRDSHVLLHTVQWPLRLPAALLVDKGSESVPLPKLCWHVYLRLTAGQILSPAPPATLHLGCLHTRLRASASPADDVHSSSHDKGQGQEQQQQEEQQQRPAKRAKRAKKGSKASGPAKDEEFGVTRGIDFKGVDTIVNFDLPSSLQGCVAVLSGCGGAPAHA
jgi:superfamily II DNA/RNA helicase